MKCPNCQNEVVNENINIQTDMGKCQNCNHLFRVSENFDSSPKFAFDINQPPKGAWYKNDMQEIKLGATLRSPIAFFLVPFMLIWSGGSLGGIYGTQIANQEFSLLQSLFGIPFIIGTLIFGFFTLLVLFGKVELTIDRQGGKVFTGIGKLGKSKSFIWNEVSRIRENHIQNASNKQQGQIFIDAAQPIRFGLGLSPERQHYIFHALKRIQMQYKPERR